jgi:hypothetical protein
MVKLVRTPEPVDLVPSLEAWGAHVNSCRAAGPWGAAPGNKATAPSVRSLRDDARDAPEP